MALGMFLNSAMFALGKVTAVEVHLLKTVDPVGIVEIDEIEKVANTVSVSEAFGVEEVVMVAGNSVAAAMATEVVAVGVFAGTDLSLEELVGTDAAVVRIPCAVEFVAGEIVAVVAVVAVLSVAWTVEIAVEAVTVAGHGVVVVAVGTVKVVGKSMVVEMVIEAGVGAAFVAVLVANSEAQGVVEVVVGLVQAVGTVAGNVLVVVVVVPGTVAVVVETVVEVATIVVVAMVVEAAMVAEAVMAAEDAEVAEAATAAEDVEVAEIATAAEVVEVAEAATAAEDTQVAEDDEVAEAAKVVEVVNFVLDAGAVELAWETGMAGFASSVKVEIEEFVTLNLMELAAGTSEVTQPGWDTAVGMWDVALLETETAVEE